MKESGERENRDVAASPLVFVILLVAAAIILVPIIGGIVFITADDVASSPDAGVNFDYDELEDELRITVFDEGNVGELHIRNVEGVIDDAQVNVAGSWVYNDGSVENNDPSVGDTVIIERVQSDDNFEVVGVAEGEEATLDGFDVEEAYLDT